MANLLQTHPQPLTSTYIPEHREKVPLLIRINDKVQEEFVNIIIPGGGESFLQSKMVLKSPQYLHLHN